LAETARILPVVKSEQAETWSMSNVKRRKLILRHHSKEDILAVITVVRHGTGMNACSGRFRLMETPNATRPQAAPNCIENARPSTSDGCRNHAIASGNKIKSK
jgi:hypothetical protein